MADNSVELARRIALAKEQYNQYAATARHNFVEPVAHISFEAGDDVTKVHIDVAGESTQYHLESMQPTDAATVYAYLNKHPIVREKYADGKTPSEEATTRRITQLAERYKTGEEPSPLHLYSGFMVTDTETGTFLGMCNIGGGTQPGHAEMARLNRPDAWQHVPADVVERYDIPTDKRITGKSYAELGTIESSTLFQYTTALKAKGCKVNGVEVIALDATNRIDNPGAWKSNAKAGFEVVDVTERPEYGPELRFEVRRSIR